MLTFKYCLSSRTFVDLIIYNPEQMKRVVLSSVLSALCIMAFTQVPESFNYQVVVRDGSTNDPLVNQDVSFRMSILKGSSSGESQYSELHSANTGDLGIVNLVIGNGTGKTGNITTIDWGADTYFLKVEIDKTGGSTYIEMGTTQLLSVPYAMYSKKTKTADYNDLSNLPILFDGSWSSLTGKPIGNNLGDMLYWNGTSWDLIPRGLPGQYLRFSASSVPLWDGATYPTLTTTSVSSISFTTATSGGNITSDGGGDITARGVCWNTETNPTILNNSTTDGDGTGIYTSSITGLAINTTYYLRSYAKNSAGVSYGNELSFKTLNDETAPVPGDGGTISIGTVTGTTITLNWTQAIDNLTDQQNLVYQIYYSTSNNINSVSDCISNGNPANSWTQDINTYQLTELSQGVIYYLNVLVKDQNNNVAAYNSISKKTITNIKIVDGARQWADGTCATNALNYSSPSDPNYEYSGDIGAGLYRLQVGSEQIMVYCDMNLSDPGWMLVLLNSVYPVPPKPTWVNLVNSVNVTGNYQGSLTGFDLFLGVKYWNTLGTTLKVEAGSGPADVNILHRATYTFSLNTLNLYSLSLSNENIIKGTTSPGIFTYHNGKKLSSRDCDNDESDGSCSTWFGNTAWWYSNCWSGSFWGDGGSGANTNNPYWTGSETDYYAWGAIWIK